MSCNINPLMAPFDTILNVQNSDYWDTESSAKLAQCLVQYRYVGYIVLGPHLEVIRLGAWV